MKASQLSRRQFLKLVAVGGATLLCLPGTVLAAICGAHSQPAEILIPPHPPGH